MDDNLTTLPLASITYDDAVTTLRTIADSRPDFIYNASDDGELGSCVYFRDGQPSCILGQLLARHGVTPDELTTYVPVSGEYVGMAGANGTVIRRLVDWGVVEVDSQRTLDLLIKVQRNQDRGSAWLAAVESAVARVEGESAVAA